MGTAFDGRGLGRVVPGLVPVDQRRDSREVEHKKMEEKELGRELLVYVKWLGGRCRNNHSFSAKVEQERAFCRRSDLRESLFSVLEVWTYIKL